jgi:DNA-binding transcriptional LysR family regulator
MPHSRADNVHGMRSRPAYATRSASRHNRRQTRREAACLSSTTPEVRETYCHECLTENPRSRLTCVSCGARLRHPKEFGDEMREKSAAVDVRTFGNVGALVLAALYGLGVAVLMPQWVAAHWIAFALVGLGMLLVGRAVGRFIARQLNDSSV